MIPKLTDDLQQAIEECGGAPLYLVDARNNRYVLLRAEQFEKYRAIFGDEAEPNETSAWYPLVEQSFLRAGWDDPEMDAYNDYDAHRDRPQS
jgi:hypothetical protein